MTCLAILNEPILNYQTCLQCEKRKVITEFVKDNRRPSGYSRECKECKRVRSKKNNDKNHSPDWKPPELHKCISCNEMLKPHYFQKHCQRSTGLKEHCKYHTTFQNCIKKNREMRLCRNQFFQLLDAPCYYCGGTENIGVDRVMNGIGYTTENCVSACWSCNKLKCGLDGPEFLKIVERISNYQAKKFRSQ